MNKRFSITGPNKSNGHRDDDHGHHAGHHNDHHHHRSGHHKDDHDHHAGHRKAIHVVSGTKGDNILDGTDGRDLIIGKQGNDWIDGGAGNDLVFGGKGNDQIDGGAGSDKVFGGKGDDLLNYTRSENVGAHDFYDGGKGTDTLQLTLTPEEKAAAQEEIDAFLALLVGNADSHCGDGRTFHFQSLDLDVRNFEALEIVTVGGGNTPPVANPDNATTDEDHPTTIDALANDFDNDTADAISLVAAAVTGGLGTASIVGNQIEYDPGANYQYLAAGESANVVIDYTIEDTHGAQGSSSVDVVVTGVNDAPVAVADFITETATATVDASLIKVAVVGGSASTYQGAAAQLDSSIFEAHAILYTDTVSDWATVLDGFDVVVLGDSGLALDYGAATGLFSALHSFVDAGGGVVTTGLFARALNLMSTDPTHRYDAGYIDDADYITPITRDGNSYAMSPATIDILVGESGHPIAGGIDSYPVQGLAHELASGYDQNGTAHQLAVGGAGSLTAIAYDDFGDSSPGRTVYLGSMYTGGGFFRPEETRDGPVDLILEQAISWAAGDRAPAGATVSIDDLLLLANDTDIDTPHDALNIDSVAPTSTGGAALSFDPTTGKIVYTLSTDGLNQLLSGEVVHDGFNYTISDGSLSSAPASVDFTIDAIV